MPQLAEAMGEAEPIGRMTFSLFRTPEAEKAVKTASTGRGKQLVLKEAQSYLRQL